MKTYTKFKVLFNNIVESINIPFSFIKKKLSIRKSRTTIPTKFQNKTQFKHPVSQERTLEPMYEDEQDRDFSKQIPEIRISKKKRIKTNYPVYRIEFLDSYEIRDTFQNEIYPTIQENQEGKNNRSSQISIKPDNRQIQIENDPTIDLQTEPDSLLFPVENVFSNDVLDFKSDRDAEESAIIEIKTSPKPKRRAHYPVYRIEIPDFQDTEDTFQCDAICHTDQENQEEGIYQSPPILSSLETTQIQIWRAPAIIVNPELVTFLPPLEDDLSITDLAIIPDQKTEMIQGDSLPETVDSLLSKKETTANDIISQETDNRNQITSEPKDLTAIESDNNIILKMIFPESIHEELSTKIEPENEEMKVIKASGPQPKDDNISSDVDNQTKKNTPDNSHESDEFSRTIRKSRNLPEKVQWEPDKYYKKFINQRLTFDSLLEDEIDEFLCKLSNNDVDSILEWPIGLIENYLFESQKRVKLIGELPVSREAFQKLCQYTQNFSNNNYLSRPKEIPPVFFITMMVFCARYSETEARKFWDPYCRLVWGDIGIEQSFQSICRDHFKACRMDLEKSTNLRFLIRTEGDVVLPVYQQAIIPNHLTGDLAAWIVDKFEMLLTLDKNNLKTFLSDSANDDSVPSNLCDFFTDERTSQSAELLIGNITNAIALFKETKQIDLVKTIIDSPIEKALWEDIYCRLIESENHFEGIFQSISKMEWIWIKDDEDIGLKISNVKSPMDQKPNKLYVISNDNFKTSKYHPNLNPWSIPNVGWELDQEIIVSERLADNEKIYIVSENYDLDQSPEVQKETVLFFGDIPRTGRPFIFINCESNRRYQRCKNKIDDTGDWIIISDCTFDAKKTDNSSIAYSDIELPCYLRNSGYQFIRKYHFDLPIKLIYEDGEITYDSPISQRFVEPTIDGEDIIPNLSSLVPPIYQSSNVHIRFNYDVGIQFSRIWFTIRSVTVRQPPISFLNLERQGLLTRSGSNIDLSLSLFLNDSGQHEIDFLYAMKSLLNEPLLIAYLPEVVIKQPDLESIFSPKEPFTISIMGAKNYTIDLSDDIKKQENDSGVTLTWKLHKEPNCKFSINNTHGGHVKFLWEINRVTAWIEGGLNKRIVKAEQEEKVILNIRGKPAQDFSWIVNTTQKWSMKLDSKGTYTKFLVDTKLRDVIKESPFSCTQVDIEINGMIWEVFRFIKTPHISIKDVRYDEQKVLISLSIFENLKGNYRFELKKNEVLSVPISMLDFMNLEELIKWDITLNSGAYIIELYLDDQYLCKSNAFTIQKIENVIPKQIIIPQTGISYPKKVVFNALTWDHGQLTKTDLNSSSLIPHLKQLISIYNTETWFKSGNILDEKRKLLPAWVVTKYPFRMTNIQYNKIIIIYPEITAYGGKAGKGYAWMKNDDEKIKVYAAWMPDKDKKLSKLVLGFPALTEQERFINKPIVAEWDTWALWPAYQCIDCGEILGSRHGSVFKLPPSIFNQHLHGHQRKVLDQFIDTFYDESLPPVDVMVNRDGEILQYSYPIDSVVAKDYMKQLKNNSGIWLNGNLDKPINFFVNTDYCYAITELFDNCKDVNKKFAIMSFTGNSAVFKKIDHDLTEAAAKIPAFCAMKRLSEYLEGNDSFTMIPKNTLLLCMLLRLKANLPYIYESLLTRVEIRENDLVQWTSEAMEGFPKLLEWSIAWAEIFFVHAIS